MAVNRVRLQTTITRWNKWLHIHVGLFLLEFLWLFVFSGIVMNHPRWFRSTPVRTEYQQQLDPLITDDDLGRAREVMAQIGVGGEIVWPPQTEPRREGQLVFRALRPSGQTRVRVDLDRNVAHVGAARAGLRQGLDVIHTLSGVRPLWNEGARSGRDWVLTRVWSFSIDVLASGLIFFVISSVYMWLRLKDQWRAGLLFLVGGVASCSFFLWGLSLL